MANAHGGTDNLGALTVSIRLTWTYSYVACVILRQKIWCLWKRNVNVLGQLTHFTGLIRRFERLFIKQIRTPIRFIE